jgi:hypothetical protein
MRAPVAMVLTALLLATLCAFPAWGSNLAGRVFEDLNENRVLDPGEPCVNARVFLAGGGAIQESRAQCTGNGSGSFFFELPAAGAYSLGVMDVSSPDLELPSGTPLQISVPATDESLIQDLPLVHRPRLQLVPFSASGILGVVRRRDGTPVSGIVVALQDEFGALLRLTTTASDGGYRFELPPPSDYHVVVTDPSGQSGGDALPGTSARKIDEDTLLVTVAGGTLYDGNNFVKVGLPAVAGPERLLAVGDSALQPGLLGVTRTDPEAPDRAVSTVRRLRENGSLFVADFAGASLYDLGNRGLGKRLETGGGEEGQDPQDQIGLARLLRVEVAPDGQFAVSALRADNRRAVYYQTGQERRRLGFLANSSDPVELAISDRQHVAYAGRGEDGALHVFRTGPGASDLKPVVDLGGTDATTIRDLQSSAEGRLAFRVDYSKSSVTKSSVILRTNESGTPQLVAGIRSTVRYARDSSLSGELRRVERPRIGPDGSVIFQGSGDSFRNFYYSSPGSSDLVPLLRGVEWSDDPATYDYDGPEGGQVAIRAAPRPAAPSALYVVVLEQGRDVPVLLRSPAGNRNLLPLGRPLLTKEWLFFLATDPNLPDDRNGSFPVGLYRAARSNPFAAPTPVAVYGDAVPSTSGARLLSVTQQPAFSREFLAVGILFQGGQTLSGGARYPFPTPGFVRIPLGGTVKDGRLEVVEGDGLSGADRRASFRDLYYGAGGSLFVESLLPGAGPLVDEIRPGTASGRSLHGRGLPGTQADTPEIQSILRANFNLGDGRRLVQTYGRVVPLPPDRQVYLFVAKFAKEKRSGEGVFTVRADGTQVSPIAVTDTPAPGGRGTFRGFTRQRAYSVEPPSVATDGTVIFEALVEANRVGAFGLFCWEARKREEAPRLLGIFPGKTLQRWISAPQGRVYFLERSGGMTALVEVASNGTRRALVSGTPVSGDGVAGHLIELRDFVLTGRGELFVHGEIELPRPPGASRQVGIFRLEPQELAASTPRLVTMAAVGQPLPLCGFALKNPGYVFRGDFVLRGESACGPLLFEAQVGHSKNDRWRGRAHFRAESPTCAQIVWLAGVGLSSKGSVRMLWVGQPLDVSCDGSTGTQSLRQDTSSIAGAVATRDEWSGRWAIYRAHGSRLTLVAREGPPAVGGSGLILDAGPLLGLASDYGPVFTVNEAGEVAFLASDGKSWGVYRSVEPRSLP